MHIALKALALVGGIGAALALPQHARASDRWTRYAGHLLCIEAGVGEYACREEYCLCRGMTIPVRDDRMPGRPE